MNRALLALLGLVAAAAAVLSFDALLGLAELVGFRRTLAWLLPVTVDAGAAAGSLVWLTRPSGPARRFGRVLALALLAGSVAGNALGHGLAAYEIRPAWWVVVAVSAVPPAVLGAVVHLSVLATRDVATESTESTEPEEPPDWWADAPRVELDQAEPGAGPDRAAELIDGGAGRRLLARELGVSEHEARQLIDARRNGRRQVTS